MDWYCARVRLAKEDEVVGQAAQLGLAGYSPRFTVNGEPDMPVFRSYAFLRFNVDEHWDAVKSIRGVVKCLPLHSVFPVAVPDDFMAVLMRRDDAGDFNIRAGRLCLKYAPGDPVSWQTRAGAEFTGKFVRQERTMAVISMTLFNQLKEVLIPAGELARA